MRVTRSIPCPMHAGNDGELSCRGELVELVLSYDDGTASAAPCSSLERQGWGASPQLVTRLTDAERLLPAAEPVGVQHRDGLVIFGGAR